VDVQATAHRPAYLDLAQAVMRLTLWHDITTPLTPAPVWASQSTMLDPTTAALTPKASVSLTVMDALLVI